MLSTKEFISLPLRLTLTAYCFAQFAVQVLWLSKWQMPRVLKNGNNTSQQRREALYAAHKQVVHYLKTLSFLDLVKFHSVGSASADPCIIIANHPSLLDFIVFLRDFPNAVCLYKSQSLKNPVLSAFVQVAGYIEGMDGTKGASKRIIEDSCQRLGEGHHVVFFPEGTRSPTTTSMKKFRTTAFHAAIKSQKAIQPVMIHCRPLFLGKKQRWIDFCRTRNLMTIQYLQPIHITELPEEKQTASRLSEMVRERIQSALLVWDDQTPEQ